MSIDTTAFEKLFADDPSEFQRLLKEAQSKITDRYGRRVHNLDKVVTPDGEVGQVIRLDLGSGRVLLQMPNKTRMLKASRVEVCRGRRRKDSLRAAV